MAKKCYLAAPFFNPVQKAGVKMMEEAIESVGFKCWSPSRDGDVCPPTADRETRKRTFASNIENLEDCDLVVAWLDWLVPDGFGVFLIRDMSDKLPIEFPPDLQKVIDVGAIQLGIARPKAEKKLIVSPGDVTQDLGGPNNMVIGLQPPTIVCNIMSHLNIPDPGTVFEFGYVFHAGLPVVTVSLAGNKLNLMLAEAAVAHVDEEDKLVPILKEVKGILDGPELDQPGLFDALNLRTCHDGEIE